MDFKSLMSAQISKSKPNSSSIATATATAKPVSKYQRRADIEAERQAAYAAEQARLESEREERAAKKRKLENEEDEKNVAREAKLRKLADESRARREAQEKEEERQKRRRVGLPDTPDKVGNDEDGHGASAGPESGEDLPEDELRSRLRELNEPAALFDESHAARLSRYRSLTNKSLVPTMSKGPIPTILQQVEEKDMRIPDQLPKDGSTEYKFLHRQLGSYFTLLLTEWNVALEQRDTVVKESALGRTAYNSFQTVIRELTPLFRQLENGSMPPDLLEPICEIVRAIQRRRYVEANDAYLRLAIGKAQWPLGVTSVGIHERSARERLHESTKQAHIMADEITRKILQSVKRCISFAQTRWPPDDIGQLMG